MDPDGKPGGWFPSEFEFKKNKPTTEDLPTKVESGLHSSVCETSALQI